ncbi:MAG: FAD-dependent oxidoreductase [Bacteroidetes bacterium]|jgi:glycine/D-amino acid oxidase-like deaminating enzyme|nr:FAD-dependent oxidoreductase [Bacteroidota bacterium]
MINTKYIIVGQGLAGTLLSYHMYQRNIDHVVISSTTLPSSSVVSAGMYNPLVFKRVTKSWMIDEVLPYLNTIYTEMEQLLKSQFLHPKSVAKFIKNDDLSYWHDRIESQNLHAYIKEIKPDFFRDYIATPHHVALVNGSGFLKTSLLLQAYQSFLRQKQIFIDDPVQYQDIQIEPNGIQYKDVSAESLIFCDGALATQNPYFRDIIPFYLTRGDLILLEIPGFQHEYIFNKDFFLLPRNEYFLLGSTYKRINQLDYSLHSAEKQLLLSKFENVLDLSYKIIQHTMGVRPTMKDRRPVLGAHPEYPNLHVFNGLGTKGVMLAPYFAREMLHKLENPKYNLNKEVDLIRFL